MSLLLLTLCATAAEGDSSLLAADDLRWLEELTAAVVDASRVPPEADVAGAGANVTGGPVIRPGGRNAYPAFWIRDYAMSLESGLSTRDEQRHMLVLTARHQRDTLWEMPSGSTAPPGSVPDHVSFGDKPIFYPGVLDDYEGQGGPLWGNLPCLDDQFFFVHMAYIYATTFGEFDSLNVEINGKPLIQRLEEAFSMPPSRPDTHLVHATDENRGVNFGFFDVVTHTGDLFFCSVLKYRATRELAELFERLDRSEDATRYESIAAAIRDALPRTFQLDNGYCRASTRVSAQPDVWGTAFAIYTGALDGEHAQRASEALAHSLRDGTIAWHGQIRHVPTDADFSESTAWEKALADKNRYQNGAYWATPVGWVCHAVARVDLEAARKLAAEYLDELRRDDFRNGPDHGAPWECMHPDGDHKQNPVYMTSVTCPLAVLRKFESTSK